MAHAQTGSCDAREGSFRASSGSRTLALSLAASAGALRGRLAGFLGEGTAQTRGGRAAGSTAGLREREGKRNVRVLNAAEGLRRALSTAGLNAHGRLA